MIQPSVSGVASDSRLTPPHASVENLQQEGKINPPGDSVVTSVSGVASDSRLTPLHQAASVENLQQEGKINPPDVSGVTSVHHANTTSDNGVTPLHQAAALIQWIISKGFWLEN